MKELFIVAHEELMEEYMGAHPEATEAEAYDITADGAWDRMKDKYADMVDHAKDLHKERDRTMSMMTSMNIHHVTAVKISPSQVRGSGGHQYISLDIHIVTESGGYIDLTCFGVDGKSAILEVEK